jgi:hypothetical protein
MPDADARPKPKERETKPSLLQQIAMAQNKEARNTNP